MMSRLGFSLFGLLCLSIVLFLLTKECYSLEGYDDVDDHEMDFSSKVLKRSSKVLKRAGRSVDGDQNQVPPHWTNVTWQPTVYPFVAVISHSLYDSYNGTPRHFHTQNVTGSLVAPNKVITTGMEFKFGDEPQRFFDPSNLTGLTVHHWAFCPTGPEFVVRDVTKLDVHGFHNDPTRQIAILDLSPLGPGCECKPVKIELNKFESRRVQLVRVGEGPESNTLLTLNTNISALEFGQMYFGKYEYQVLLPPLSSLTAREPILWSTTAMGSAILDHESGNLLAILFYYSDQLTRSFYRAYYFDPELKGVIERNIGHEHYVLLNETVSKTDPSITYLDQSLNVSKPDNFTFRLVEVTWDAHPYIVRICNTRTRQICSATLVDDNTLVASPSCITQRGEHDTLLVHHLVRGPDSQFVAVNREITSTWIGKQLHSCGTVEGPLYIDYLFMNLSALSPEVANNYSVSSLAIDRSHKADKPFRYVRLVSLASSLYSGAGQSTCDDMMVPSTWPKLIQLDTLASLSQVYYGRAYDCHIFDGTEKTVNHAMLTPKERKHEMYYGGLHVGIHNFDRFDYSLLFSDSAALVDFSDPNKLIGIGFVEECQGDRNCRTEKDKSINVYRAMIPEYNAACAAVDGAAAARVNVTLDIYDSSYCDNSFVVYLSRKTPSYTKNVLYWNFDWPKHSDHHESLCIRTRVFVVSAMYEVAKIVYVGAQKQFAIVHLKDKSDDDAYRSLHFNTAKIELNRLIPRKKVKMVSSGFEHHNERLTFTELRNKTELHTVTIDLTEYDQQLNESSSSSFEYAIPLRGTPALLSDLGAPIVDPVSGHVLALVSRYAPYSHEQVYIVSYFDPDLEQDLKDALGPEYSFARQNPALNSHLRDDAEADDDLSALSVTKPEHFVYNLSEVNWDNHRYIVRICDSGNKHSCTGILVDSDTVVALSTCVIDRSADVYVYVIAQNEMEPVIRRASTEARLHSCKSGHLPSQYPTGYTVFKLSHADYLSTRPEYVTLPRVTYHENDQFRYVRLISFIKSAGSPLCASNATLLPKLAQLNTLATYNYAQEGPVYQCPIFHSTTIDLSDELKQYANKNYSKLFRDGAVLVDYHTNKLLGIAFDDLCDATDGHSQYCQAQMNKSARLVRVAKLSGDYLSKCSNQTVEQYRTSAFVVLIELPPENATRTKCTGSLVASNLVVTSSVCVRNSSNRVLDPLSLLKVRHVAFLRGTFPEIVARTVTRIVVIKGSIAFVHLAALPNLYKADTAKMELNRFVALRSVHLPKYDCLLDDFSDDSMQIQFATLQSGLVDIELIRQLEKSSSTAAQYGIPLEGRPVEWFHVGAPVIDARSGNILAVVGRCEPYSLENLCIANYFSDTLVTDAERKLEESDLLFVRPQEATTPKSEPPPSPSSSNALYVEKPANFSYLFSRVNWQEHLYLAKVCNHKSGQTCAATLIDSDTAITSAACETILTNLADFTVSHYVQYAYLPLTGSFLIKRTVLSVEHDNYHSSFSGNLSTFSQALHKQYYVVLKLKPLSPLYKVHSLEYDCGPEEKQFRYVQLVSLVTSKVTSTSVCSESEPSLIRLNTLAVLTPFEHLHTQTYFCQLFQSALVHFTQEDIRHGLAGLNGFKGEVEETKDEVGWEDRKFVHIRKQRTLFDYTSMFQEAIALRDFESGQLLGIGRLMNGSIVRLAKFKPESACQFDGNHWVGKYLSAQMKIASELSDEDRFVVIIQRVDDNNFSYCTGALLAPNIAITSEICVVDTFDRSRLLTTQLKVLHIVSSSSSSNIYVAKRVLTNITFIDVGSPNDRFAILHLSPFPNENDFHFSTVKIGLNQFVERRTVTLVTYEHKLMQANQMQLHKLDTSTVDSEFSRQSSGGNSSVFEYGIALGDDFEPAQLHYGSPILDPVSGNLLALVSRFESYSLANLYIAAYFHPQLVDKLKEMQLETGSFVRSTVQSDSKSSRVLDVSKPVNFKYSLNSVDWQKHESIGRVCNRKTEQICSGVLISDDEMVTSSNCVSLKSEVASLTVNHPAKNLATDANEIITRQVASIRTESHPSQDHHHSVGYTILSLSAAPVGFKFVPKPKAAPHQPDRQFRYVRVLSLLSSVSPGDESCNVQLAGGATPKLIQLDTLASLNYEHNDLVYDCPIFKSAIANSNLSEATLSQSDFALMARDGAVLFDYESNNLLGIGFDRRCDSPLTTDHCPVRLVKPINVIQVVRFASPLDGAQIAFQPAWRILHSWWFAFCAGILTCAIFAFLCYYFRFEIQNFQRRLQGQQPLQRGANVGDINLRDIRNPDGQPLFND